MESAVAGGAKVNFPRSPDAFALAETVVIDIVRSRVGLHPVTLAFSGIVAAIDHETADIVDPVADYSPLVELEVQVHPMFVGWRVIVKPGPRP